MEDQATVLAEMKRVVRRVVVASEPDWGTLAIDGADAATRQTVCDTLCREHIRNGWIGRQLAGHFARLGVTAIEIHPVTLAVRSLPLAADLLGLRQVANDAWLAQLEESHSRMAFFASITGFTVTGRVGPDMRIAPR